MPLSNKGPGPIDCRTAAEARFIERHWPCPECGEPIAQPAARISIKETRKAIAGGREELTRGGFCSQCGTKLERVYTYPKDAAAPKGELGGKAPSTALSAAELEGIIREALAAPADAKALSEGDYWRWRERLVGAIAAANEAAKLGASTKKAKADIEARLVTYNQPALHAARKKELEASRAKIHAFTNEALAAHRAWLKSAGKKGARLELEGAVIENMGIRGEIDLSKARLVDCAVILQVLDYSLWVEAELVGTRGFYTRIGMSKLGGASFSDCRFRGASFMIADLKKALVRGGDFRAVSFIRSDLDNSRFEAVDLREARFGDSVLDGARFEGCDLRGADFSAVNPTFAHRGTTRGAVFSRCDLRGALFAGRHLAGVRFESCQLGDVSGPAAAVKIDVVGGSPGEADVRAALAARP